MLTLKQIFTNLYRFPQARHDDRFDRAIYVRVTGLKIGTHRSTGATRIICRTQTPERHAMGTIFEKYTTTIDFHDKAKVKISCSCPDFWATWEYALWKKGSADLIYGNGDPPVVKNFRRIGGCCKHVVKTADVLVNKNYLNHDFELASRSTNKGKK